MTPHELSATQAAEAIRAGTLTSEHLIRSCLERIAARDHLLRAWEHLDAEAALAQARARDAERPAGPLHGVPVGVKDIIDTADAPTGYGSPVYAGHRPERDAACVERLRAAGAVILGKTVTTEFALFSPGRTTNPHDPRRTPGGSSSGSAAAVADGHVPLALGTQTAGSIVRPASFCGVFGLKPTFGAYPLDGIQTISPSLDTLGHFARTAADLSVLAGVLGEAGPVAEAGGGTAPRVGFARTAEWRQAAPSTRERIEALAERLRAHTAVTDVVLPDEFSRLVEAQETIMAAEAARSLAPERRNHASALSDRLLELLDFGAGVPEAAFDAAAAQAEVCRAQLDGVFAGCDVLLAPSVLGEAPTGLDATGDPLFCRAWTLLGTPTVSVPGLAGPQGLPLGVQLVGPSGGDSTVVTAAGWLAERLPPAGVGAAS